MENRPEGRRHGFRPRERLHRKAQFTEILERGARFSAGGITFMCLRTGGAASRLGVIVGRRNGNAVARNRIRRLLREGFRLSKHRLPCAVDVVLIPAPSATLTLDRVLRAFAAFARALGAERP